MGQIGTDTRIDHTPATPDVGRQPQTIIGKTARDTHGTPFATTAIGHTPIDSTGAAIVRRI